MQRKGRLHESADFCVRISDDRGQASRQGWRCREMGIHGLMRIWPWIHPANTLITKNNLTCTTWTAWPFSRTHEAANPGPCSAHRR